MDGKSLSPREEKIKQLQNLFPEIVTEGKINWKQLRATLGGYIDTGNERYGLSWAGKSDAFQTLQTPTSHTLVPDLDASTHFNTTQNIFIEGENLDVLKVLQRSYFGKVKMIYIDPPYNTGNDAFVYNDHYTENRLQYQKKAGDKDTNGHKTHESILRKNSKDQGHYHSNWLNMMYPRLFLAKSLLQDDGVIFVSIDDHEVHNLRLIMNEIFGEENFVSCFIWKTKNAARGVPTTSMVIKNHEYLLCYTKSSDKLRFKGEDRDEADFMNPDNDPRGLWRSESIKATGSRKNIFKIINPENSNEYEGNWAFSEPKIKAMIKDKLIIFPKNKKGVPRQKKFINAYLNKKKAIVTDLGRFSTENATKMFMSLFGNLKIFPFPKPINLIKLLLEQTTSPNDLILDFFAGSATTAQAVMELNQEDGGHRRYICVQMAESCDESSEAFQAGFHTIAEIAKERIRRAAKKIQTTHPNYQGDLGCKVFSLQKSNFTQWQQPAPRTEHAQ